jgi:small-conductance mechanosensitive channel
VPFAAAPTALLTAVPASLPASLPEAIRFRSCVTDKETGTLCDRVYDWFGQKWLAESADWLLAKPVAIGAILVIAVVIRFLLHRVIRRLAHRAAEGTVPGVLAKGKGHRLIESSPLLSERRKQRADTMSSVLRSVTTGVIMSVAFLMILDTIGLPIGPLLASAGIVGVAVGFGAQTLVKDFLSGIFLILEDQYGVGDLIDTGMGTVGTVEAVGLRVTRLRDGTGVVWYVRNGEILQVGNHSQGWSTGIVDVAVAYTEDIPRVQALIGETAQAMYDDEDWQPKLLEVPTVAGVESVTGNSVTIRVIAKCTPNEHWGVQRELRERIKEAIDREGVQDLLRSGLSHRGRRVRGEGEQQPSGLPGAEEQKDGAVPDRLQRRVGAGPHPRRHPHGRQGRPCGDRGDEDRRCLRLQ